MLEGLRDFLRIPSVSALPEHRADVRLAAEFLRAEMERIGLHEAQLIEGDGFPLVYAEHLQAPGKPTILFYGHYDVQPAEPLEEWHSPPFEPEIRGEDLFARGAADDKAQVWLQLKAIESLLKEDGRLPVNVRFLYEGEEETGGRHIEHFVASGSPLLTADAALISDTELFAPGTPSLCIGLRGILYAELTLKGPKQDLHSGSYGGVAPNPLQAMAEIICALKDSEGRLTIPGIYDDVRRPTVEEEAAWQRLPFDERKFLEAEVGSRSLTGEPHQSVLHRIWARPTFEVHGIVGGWMEEGPKTVIPAEATAKLSMRLVPDQHPDRCAQLLAAAVRNACPEGITAELRILHGASPSLMDPENRYIRLAAQALSDVFQQPAAFVRNGGSIPIAGLFQKRLGVPSVLLGFGLPDDNAHAPNEKFHLPNFLLGVKTIRRYLRLLGED